MVFRVNIGTNSLVDPIQGGFPESFRIISLLDAQRLRMMKKIVQAEFVDAIEEEFTNAIAIHQNTTIYLSQT